MGKCANPQTPVSMAQQGVGYPAESRRDQPGQLRERSQRESFRAKSFLLHEALVLAWSVCQQTGTDAELPEFGAERRLGVEGGPAPVLQGVKANLVGQR